MLAPLLAPVIAFAATLAGVAAASADSLRWPEPQRPPYTLAVLQRAPAVAAYLMPIADRRGARRCPANHICVVCLAGCDEASPALVHSMVPRSTAGTASGRATADVVADGSDNDTDGIADNAPRFARQEWAGIVCGAEGGCRGAGIPPPRPAELYISVHRYKH